MSVAQSPDDVASDDLGTLLRQARERRGLTVDEIARRTKIPKRHLESLERNNLEALPPGMYRRGEVLAYAAAVGLDPQQALASLTRMQNASSRQTEERIPEQKVAPARERRPVLRLGVTAVLVLSVLVGTWWFLRQPEAGPPAVSSQDSPGDPAARPRGDETATALVVGAGDTRLSGTSMQSGDAAAARATPAAPVAETRPTPTPTEYPDLIVITQPPGARITVDGVGWGPSPQTIRFLPPGVRRVRATLDGYIAQERVVSVSGDAPRTTVRLTLKKSP